MKLTQQMIQAGAALTVALGTASCATPGSDHAPALPLDTAQAASHDFAQAGTYIIFGDQHGDAKGHADFVKLIPELALNNVKVIALEHPVEYTKLFAKVQPYIRQYAGSPEILHQQINSVFQPLKSSMRPEAYDFMIAILIAASAPNIDISVIGIDARFDPANIASTTAILEYIQNAKTTPDLNMLLFADKDTANHAKEAKPEQGREAIVFGGEHLCLDKAGVARQLVDTGAIITRYALGEKIAAGTSALGCTRPAETVINLKNPQPAQN